MHILASVGTRHARGAQMQMWTAHMHINNKMKDNPHLVKGIQNNN